jgi:hypothetical protein
MQGIWTMVFFRSQAFLLTTLRGLLIPFQRGPNRGPKLGSRPVLDLWRDRNAYAQEGV